MEREIIRRLSAWDVAAGLTATIEPGSIISSWKIRRDVDGEPDPYVVEFISAARAYRTPLADFLPRTQVLEAAGEQVTAERVLAATAS